MIHFTWAIAAFFIGGSLGIFLAALCNVAAQNDREDEERRLRENVERLWKDGQREGFDS
jgi:hypothetical protein